MPTLIEIFGDDYVILRTFTIMWFYSSLIKTINLSDIVRKTLIYINKN